MRKLSEYSQISFYLRNDVLANGLRILYFFGASKNFRPSEVHLVQGICIPRGVFMASASGAALVHCK